MKLEFLGAAGEVTGSCLLVETENLRFLVDCGMFQGGGRGADSAYEKNRHRLTRDLGRLDFILLTHAHIDHSGLLPRFARHGPVIWCTKPTADLLGPMLRDSAHIQSRNERPRHRRHGEPERAPLYSIDDVEQMLTRVAGVPYDAEFRPHAAVSVVFRNAGHIIGAAIVEIRLDDAGLKRRLVISGDLGEADPMVVKNRADIADADVLVLESTYGDRNHRSLAETETELVAVLRETLHERRGNVIVPAFALGRTQALLVLLYRLAREGKIEAPLVFVDSPLARAASDITFRHLEALDELAHEFRAAERAHQLPFALKFTESVEDSIFLNQVRAGAVIIAASGMCDAGRIRHHLLHNLGRRECAILFTGFQAAGTLGRRLVDGAREVTLMGETVPVRARVHTLGGLSAHAGQDSLVQWLAAFRAPPAHCFIVHGEPPAAAALAARVRKELHGSPVIAEPFHPYTV